MVVGTGAAILGAAGIGAASSLLGGKKGQTTTQSTSVPDWQQPYVSKGFQAASDLYDKGPPQYYPGQTVAAPGQTTQRAIDDTYKRAADGSPVTDSAQNSITGILNGSYGNPSTGYFDNVKKASYTDNPASSYFQDTQNGQYLDSNPVNSFLTGQASGYNKNLNGIAAGKDLYGNPINNLLSSTATGAYLNNNPYIDQTYNNAADAVTRNYQNAVAPGVDSTFESSGRYGSGLAKNAQEQAKVGLGKSLSDLATQIYGGNYANERQNQLSASGQIGNAYSTAQGQRIGAAQDIAGNQLSAAGQIGSAYSNERGLQQGAAADLGNVYQQQAARSDAAATANSNNYNLSQQQKLQAASLAPTLANQDYVDLQNLKNVGGMQDLYQQQLLDADKAKYDANQQAPYTALQRYQQGITGNYGTQSTSTAPASNNIAGTLGTLAGAYLGGNNQLAGSAGQQQQVMGLPWLSNGSTVQGLPWLNGGY